MAEQQTHDTVTVEINGTTYTVEKGKSVIQVADEKGIYIPRFCYHKKLSVAANCRMCLVDIEGARKPSPACATFVMDGMKVFTKSPTTLAYQKSVMEFLLANHPLDCPICDQGGECELQDVAMGYGNDESAYQETKRAFYDPDLGSLIETHMNRCIQCTRCVRFGQEIAGIKELGAMGRGDHTEIGTYVAKAVDSELSGNMIDVCPVGALTSKPFRYEARAWEMQQYPTISQADGMGANLYANTRRGKLLRVVPRENEAINETWIADKDRFEYAGLYAKDRLDAPIIKKGDQWVHVSWEEGLDFVKTALTTTLEKQGADQIAALASEACSVEELYLLQKLMRGLGCKNIDTRLMQGHTQKAVTAGTGINCSPSQIAQSDFVLLLGSNLRKEYPLLNLRVKQATENGGKVVALNHYNYQFNYDVEQKVVEATEFPSIVAALLRAVCKRQIIDLSYYPKLQAIFRQVDVTDDLMQIAESLLQAENPVILLGYDGVLSQDFAQLYAFVETFKTVLSAKGGVLAPGPNAKGAYFAGALPFIGAKHQIFDPKDQGVSAYSVLSGQTDTQLALLYNMEPEADSLVGQQSLKTLKQMDMVIAFSPYASESMKQYADIILPIATHYESSGTVVNLNGQVQSYQAVAKPYYETRPGWKVLRVLGNLLEQPGFEYQSTEDVLSELDMLQPGDYSLDIGQIIDSSFPLVKHQARLMPCVSMYKTTNLLRRSEPLQQTNDARWYATGRISPYLADQLKINEYGEIAVTMEEETYHVSVKVDQNVAKRTIIMPFQQFSSCIVNWESVRINPVDKEGLDA